LKVTKAIIIIIQPRVKGPWSRVEKFENFYWKFYYSVVFLSFNPRL